MRTARLGRGRDRDRRRQGHDVDNEGEKERWKRVLTFLGSCPLLYFCGMAAWATGRFGPILPAFHHGRDTRITNQWC
jgi:hypothetical protein